MSKKQGCFFQRQGGVKMTIFKPATITKGSFAFCRATVAILVWITILLKIKWLLVVVLILMLWSAIAKVEKAPLILLYKNTVESRKATELVVVDERGIYISHLVGAIFSAVCLILLYLPKENFGWAMTIIFALLQTSAAFGYCSALKLYTCMTSGTCCRFGKTVKKIKDHRNV